MADGGIASQDQELTVIVSKVPDDTMLGVLALSEAADGTVPELHGSPRGRRAAALRLKSCGRLGRVMLSSRSTGYEARQEERRE